MHGREHSAADARQSFPRNYRRAPNFRAVADALPSSRRWSTLPPCRASYSGPHFAAWRASKGILSSVRFGLVAASRHSIGTNGWLNDCPLGHQSGGGPRLHSAWLAQRLQVSSLSELLTIEAATSRVTATAYARTPSPCRSRPYGRPSRGVACRRMRASPLPPS